MISIHKQNKEKIDNIYNNIYKNLTEDYLIKDDIMNIALFDKDSGNVKYGYITLDQIMSKVKSGIEKEYSK